MPCVICSLRLVAVAYLMLALDIATLNSAGPAAVATKSRIKDVLYGVTTRSGASAGDLSDVYVDPKLTFATAGVVIYHNGIPITSHYRHLENGFQVAIQGKIFSVSDLYVRKESDADPKMGVNLRAIKDSPLKKLISTADDTVFLPIDGRFYTRKVTVTVEVGSTKQIKCRATSSDVKLPADQGEQLVGVGDVIRFDQYGFKIRNIVMPDKEKKIVGWIEVEGRELTFEPK